MRISQAIRYERVPMKSFRRWSVAVVLAVMVVFTGLLLASCGKNDLTGLMGQGQASGLWVHVGIVGPTGPGYPVESADSVLHGHPVNSIDSVTFLEDVDPKNLEVTSFSLRDSASGIVCPGTARYFAANQYIRYSGAFPDTSVALRTGRNTASTWMAKVYFIPSRPLSGHRTYTYSLTTRVNMVSGKFVRDVQSWNFVTGDSVAPPAAPSRPS
jgi:hypothetical protein